MTTLSDPTLEQVATAYDVEDLLELLKRAELPTQYDMLGEAYARFHRSIEVKNLEARASAIEEALRDPFIRKEQAYELLNELAEIETKLQKIGE